MPLRVLLVPNTAASMVWFRLPFLRALAARGHRTWVAAPDGWGVEPITETGASFLPVFQHQGWAFGAAEDLDSSYTDPFRDLRYLRDLRRIVRVVRPHLVLAYTHKLSVLVPFAVRASGVAADVHGMITGFGPANLRRTWREELVRQAFLASLRPAAALSDTLIVLNADNRQTLLDHRIAAPDRVFHLDGEGVDTERFDDAPPPFEPGAPTFLMVARLVRYKGVETYLSAAERVRRTHPRARFVLAGTVDPAHPDAVPAERLEEVRRQGLVELIGHVGDIRPWLHDSHVFVLPSGPTEGLPMSLMEAMATRHPLLTTRVPGNRETVEDGVNGWLSDDGDAEALAEHMARLADDPALAARMGEASRARCEARFDHRVVNAALIDHLGL